MHLREKIRVPFFDQAIHPQHTLQQKQLGSLSKDELKRCVDSTLDLRHSLPICLNTTDREMDTQIGR